MNVLLLVRTNKCVGLFNSLTFFFFFSYRIIGWRNETELGFWGRHWRIGIDVPVADKRFGVIIAVVSLPSSLPCSNNLYPDPLPGPSVWSGCPWAWPEQREETPGLLCCPSDSLHLQLLNGDLFTRLEDGPMGAGRSRKTGKMAAGSSRMCCFYLSDTTLWDPTNGHRSARLSCAYHEGAERLN